jgi:hypothetical protein
MSESNGLAFPKQRLSYKDKIAKDFQWGKDMIDNLELNYYGSSYNYNTDSTVDRNGRADYSRKLSNYDLYNNKIYQQDFERECNALGIEIGQFVDEVKPYNKTPNKIGVLLGEELLRPFNYRPILINSEGIRTKQAAFDEALRGLIQENVEELITTIRSRYNMNVADQERQQLEQEIQEKVDSLVDATELSKLRRTSYLDQREIMASRILEYLRLKLRLRSLMNDAFKHGLIAGEEVVWVGVRNGEPTVEIINPLGFFYDKSPEVKYVQNGMYAGYRTMMTSGDIIDRYAEFLNDEDIEKLEGPIQGINGARADLIAKDMRYHHSDIYTEMLSRTMGRASDEGSYGNAEWGTHWQVTHVEWRSERKVYFVKSTGEDGEEKVEILSEDFVIPPGSMRKTKKVRGRKITYYEFQDITVEEGWIPEVWEGTKIGSDIYVGIGPKPYQYRSMDNPYSVKLGYHGLVYNNMNSESISLMDRMRPFQFLYFIIAHKLKQLVAKDKGQMVTFDTSLVPEELGLEKVLYYMENFDINFINSLQNAEEAGAYQRSIITSATNRSNMQHIMSYIQLLDAIDTQISDVAGITRQREGQTPNNQAVTNAQQDLMQSSTVTEAVYFSPHFDLWREVLESLLQYSQAAWKDKSIIKQYVLDDGSIETLNLTPTGFENSDFGVFISNSSKDNEVFQTLKQLTQPLLQNDKATMVDIIKIFKATSVQQLQQQIEESELKAQQMQSQQLEENRRMAQEAQKFQLEQQERQRQHELEIERMKAQTDLAVAGLKAQVDSEKNAPNETNLERAKFELDKEIAKEKIKLDKKKLEQDKKLKEEQLRIQKQKSTSK